MRLSERPLIAQAEIDECVKRLARDIAARHQDGRGLVLVVVLKGATIFAADLMRCLDVHPLRIEYIRAKSYDGTHSMGEVELIVLPDLSVAGQRVLVVEDILDTGRTTTAILSALENANPASLELCTLLDKPSRRVVPVDAQYVGFSIDDHFVVGYGLDYREAYRSLPEIYVLEPSNG
ncbi:MAG: hypoxanthine phosphoribosyltransferase [Candidatus Hydrogenedentes bacterium]|nr:hypoxanthine phosphoribosyltransferase [Candidatus Hydrogenedentota bacterium]